MRTLHFFKTTFFYPNNGLVLLNLQQSFHVKLIDMKKNILYFLLLIVFAGSVGFILLQYHYKEQLRQNMVYTLLPRKGLLAKTDEWIVTQKNVALLQQKIKVNPADDKSMIALANYFILEARATGNYSYYDAASMKLVNDVLKNDANNFEALTLKSLIYLSQHHFADGLATAQQARNIIPYNAFVHGILVDGNVEMGNYDSALACAQTMMDIRPDLRSYARASYLREIFGDYTGAIDAMKLAIEAGAPGDEATEWSRVQLGHLYENTGDIRSAEMCYGLALAERPGYMYACAGMAHLALASKDYGKAVRYYQQAASDVAGNAFMQDLATVYFLSGRGQQATETTKKLIADLNANAASASSNENIGHYADKELAYAYLSIHNTGKALEHALLEYNRRPKNIEVNETVAWMYFNNNEVKKALPYLQEALKTNSKNPTLLCRAGLIFAKSGDTGKAKKYLQDGLQNNPNIEETLKEAVSQQLKEQSIALAN